MIAAVGEDADIGAAECDERGAALMRAPVSSLIQPRARADRLSVGSRGSYVRRTARPVVTQKRERSRRHRECASPVLLCADGRKIRRGPSLRVDTRP